MLAFFITFLPQRNTTCFIVFILNVFRYVETLFGFILKNLTLNLLGTHILGNDRLIFTTLLKGLLIKTHQPTFLYTSSLTNLALSHLFVHKRDDRPTNISVHWIEGRPINMGEAEVELLLSDTSWEMGSVDVSWSDTGVLFAF